MRKIGKLVLLVTPVQFSDATFAADIGREGTIEVPTQQEAQTICSKNPFINNNTLLLGCVNQETESARNALRLLDQDRKAASEAYGNCVENPYIDNYALLYGCMEQEVDAYHRLQ